MSVALSSVEQDSIRQTKALLTQFSDTSLQGDTYTVKGAVPKDGPSAGTAITVALFSLFNNVKINNTVAITGESHSRSYCNRRIRSKNTGV